LKYINNNKIYSSGVYINHDSQQRQILYQRSPKQLWYQNIKTRVEVAECFRVAIPENNQRPDLMLYNAPDFNKQVVADVCITCPIPVAASAPLSLTNARKPGRAAQLARSGQETKYKAACDAKQWTRVITNLYGVYWCSLGQGV
jgi:hypothetical protein